MTTHLCQKQQVWRSPHFFVVVELALRPSLPLTPSHNTVINGYLLDVFLMWQKETLPLLGEVLEKCDDSGKRQNLLFYFNSFKKNIWRTSDDYCRFIHDKDIMKCVER
jgi:hypothetical protein